MNSYPIDWERAMDFTYLPVCQYGSAAAAEEYGSFSALLDNFYAKREQADRVKQKTAYEITYGDWSSDVCSSDLLTIGKKMP